MRKYERRQSDEKKDNWGRERGVYVCVIRQDVFTSIER